jgi:hypothetical protein
VIYKNSQASPDPIFNIELILSSEEIDDLCRKLPTSHEDVMDRFIHIAEEIKKAPYMREFVDEIAMFVEFERIDKEGFVVPGIHIPNIPIQRRSIWPTKLIRRRYSSSISTSRLKTTGIPIPGDNCTRTRFS